MAWLCHLTERACTAPCWFSLFSKFSPGFADGRTAGSLFKICSKILISRVSEYFSMIFNVVCVHDATLLIINGDRWKYTLPRKYTPWFSMFSNRGGIFLTVPKTLHYSAAGEIFGGILGQLEIYPSLDFPWFLTRGYISNYLHWSPFNLKYIIKPNFSVGSIKALLWTL